MGIHVSITKELKDSLDKYRKYKKSSTISAVVSRALSKMFAQEGSPPIKHFVYKDIIDKRLNLPNHHTYSGTMDVLLLLSKRYPKASSKQFWGDLVYALGEDKNHSEMFDEIKEEIQIWQEKLENEEG